MSPGSTSVSHSTPLRSQGAHHELLWLFSKRMLPANRIILQRGWLLGLSTPNPLILECQSAQQEGDWYQYQPLGSLDTQIRTAS